MQSLYVEKAISNGANEFNVENLPEGLYMIQLRDKNHMEQKKILISHKGD